MPGRSTTWQLLRISDVWTEKLDNGIGVDNVHNGFQNAFDSVLHERLLETTAKYGIERKPLKRLRDLVFGTKQHVKIKEKYSKWEFIRSGIPQVAVIAPAILIILNSVLYCVSSTFTCMLMMSEYTGP